MSLGLQSTRIYAVLSLSICFLAFIPPAIAQPPTAPTVNVTPPPAPTVTTFSHDSPPTDLKPGEAADASFNVEVSGGAYDLVKNADGTYSVQNVGQVDVTGSTEIRLPDNASQTLKDHESGHGDLYSEEYNRIAKEETETAFRGFEGMKFSDPDAEAKAAAERDRRLELAAQAIQQKIETLSEKYDNLTKHGTSDTVNTAQGKAQALKERDDAIRAKNDPPQPPGKPTAGNYDPPSLKYDSSTGLLTFDFAGSPLDFSSAGISDPILGATVKIDPMLVVGVGADGRMDLGNSRLTIEKDGTTLLTGTIWEAVYGPSVLPLYGGMMQGYLDLAPWYAEAPGINNAISSGFLDSFGQSLNDPAGAALSRVWFFTDESMFNDTGEVLRDSSSGNMKFGEAVPEPGAAILLITVLAGVWAVRRLAVVR
jgi:hypothetical protein